MADDREDAEQAARMRQILAQATEKGMVSGLRAVAGTVRQLVAALATWNPDVSAADALEFLAKTVEGVCKDIEAHGVRDSAARSQRFTATDQPALRRGLLKLDRRLLALADDDEGSADDREYRRGEMLQERFNLLRALAESHETAAA